MRENPFAEALVSDCYTTSWLIAAFVQKGHISYICVPMQLIQCEHVSGSAIQRAIFTWWSPFRKLMPICLFSSSFFLLSTNLVSHKVDVTNLVDWGINDNNGRFMS